jgi:ketosteroid isomerase-like protein
VKSLLFSLAVCAMSVQTAAFAQTADAAPDYAEEVMQADRDFSAMAKTDGLGEAFATYMDSVDGRIIRGRSEPLRGEDAIRESYSSIPDPVILHWYPEEGFASEAGDFGATWGSYEVHRDGDMDTPAHERGRYLTVWRRNADGEWRGILDMGTQDGSYQRPEDATRSSADSE